MNVDAEKDIRFFCGASGSGKSHAIKQTIEDERRVLIFDPEGEYAQDKKFKPTQGFTRWADFVAAVKEQHMKDDFRLSFEGQGPQMFELFNLLVWKVAQESKKPVVEVVDELAGIELTNSKAQGQWHTNLTRGRKHLIKIRAGAQSPTEVSKTIMRQRSHLWVGHMTRRADWAYMAGEIPVPAEQFEALRPAPFFDSIVHMQGKDPIIRKG